MYSPATNPALHFPLQTRYVEAIASITTNYPCKTRVERVPRCRPRGPTLCIFLRLNGCRPYPIGQAAPKCRESAHKAGTDTWGTSAKLFPRARNYWLTPPSAPHFVFVRAPCLRPAQNQRVGTPDFLRDYFIIAPSAIAEGASNQKLVLRHRPASRYNIDGLDTECPAAFGFQRQFRLPSRLENKPDVGSRAFPCQTRAAR